MDERVMQFRVGVLFLGTLILVAILLVLFGKMPTYVGTYPVRVEFENAAGISKGSPVRKNGMLIGRVADLCHQRHAERHLRAGDALYQGRRQ